MESRLTAWGWGPGGRGIGPKRKEEELLDTDNSVVIARGKGYKGD